jgi:hypothetical protein
MKFSLSFVQKIAPIDADGQVRQVMGPGNPKSAVDQNGLECLLNASL